MDRDEIVSELKRLEPWFHCIDLGEGLNTKTQSAIGEPVEHPRPTWQKVKPCLPRDLSGQSVLDVGCNAGFYSIEMKRRGAGHVLGIDSQRELIRQARFVNKVLCQDIEYRRMSVYDLDPRDIGQFDVTLALGLIYHCKHLVMALEKLFLVTRRLLVLETAIYPPEKAPRSFEYAEGGARPTLHPLAYVENLPDAKEAVYNWFLPSTAALTALLKNVGFDEVKAFPAVQSDRVIMACRKSEPYPDSRSITFLAAELALISGPSAGRTGQVLSFVLRAHNTGYATWRRGNEERTEAGDVHLVVHLLNESGDITSWYHAGAFLPHDVQPGENVEVKIDLPAPAAPGNYTLEFDMVSEHLAWFEDLGSAVLQQHLVVT